MRSLLTRSTAVILFLASVGACVSSTEPEEALTVTPAASQYARDSLGFAVITFRVSNAGRSTVYLSTCGSTVSAQFEQRAASAFWATSFASSGCYLSFYAGPYRLEPGQSVQGVQSGRFTPGEYRLSVPVSLSATADANRVARSGSIRIL